MVKKSTQKTQLINAIKKIPMDPSRKKNLILALTHIQEPIPHRELSLFFTLLDLNNTLQNTVGNGYAASQTEVTQNWRLALQFYKEHELDRELKLSSAERKQFTEFFDDLIEYNQQSNQVSKAIRQWSKR